MCGRSVLAGNKTDLVSSFEIRKARTELRRSWNVAQMTDIPATPDRTRGGREEMSGRHA
ncbi:hypothetical protein [uncultured Arthrobacter sp.]|uniref:hypothetical protein n=1 Tax=uncultured Arthrobacter sp. TaxID=114050 RepID=UPI002605C4CA|nr:hypothetical protein [uncultured Arthrobacter sp.]